MEPDPGYGPPPGNPTGPARGGGVPFDVLAKANKQDEYLAKAALNPALQGTIDPTAGMTESSVKLVYRDVPIVAIQNTWSVQDARGALYSHILGIFYTSGMLCESIMGDDRVTACLASKATALFGREARFKPANDSAAAKECAQAWMDWWPMLEGGHGLRMMQDYSTMMGFAHSQLVWRETPSIKFAPTIFPWFPQFEYYDWSIRRFMAIADGPTVPIIPGNGKWLEHAPFGSYRGWMRAAIRPVCEPWLLRHFGFRDMARFGEVHGNPTRKGYVPAVGDPVERADFERALAALGADTAMIVPRAVDGQDGTGYDYELVEAKSGAWEVHPAQIDRCDMAIVLAILMQNLTTQVEGGSYGAAKVHMDVRQGGTLFDNLAWKHTIYTQLARPFAALNFGDPDLAPWTWRDVVGTDEYEHNADQWNKAATGLNQFAQAGIRFSDAGEVRAWLGETFGLRNFPAFTMTDPVQQGLSLKQDGPPPPKGKGKAK